MDESKERELKFALELYKEVGVNWRYWGEMRFKQVTVFVLLFAALVAAACSEQVNCVMPARVAIGALGLVLSVTLLFAEERATYYRRAFMSCALALEQRNEFEKIAGIYAYTRTYNPWPLRTDALFRSLFSVGAGTWAGYASFALSGRSPGWTLSAGVIVALGVFSGAAMLARLCHDSAERAGFRRFCEVGRPPTQRRSPLIGFWTLPSPPEPGSDTTKQES